MSTANGLVFGQEVVAAYAVAVTLLVLALGYMVVVRFRLRGVIDNMEYDIADLHAILGVKNARIEKKDETNRYLRGEIERHTAAMREAESRFDDADTKLRMVREQLDSYFGDPSINRGGY